MDWLCPYQIVGLGGSRVEVAYGLDAIQALQLALEAIRLKLERISQCTWEGGDNGDTGFPRSVPSSFGRDFSIRVERHIDVEVARMLEMARRRAVRTQAKRQRESLKADRVERATTRREGAREDGRIAARRPARGGRNS